MNLDSSIFTSYNTLIGKKPEHLLYDRKNIWVINCEKYPSYLFRPPSLIYRFQHLQGKKRDSKHSIGF